MNEALLIKQLLTHIANAQFCADAVILDMNLKGSAKDKFNRIKKSSARPTISFTAPTWILLSLTILFPLIYGIYL